MGKTNELRRLRMYHDLTLEDMGKLIGVTGRSYSDKEKGINQFKQYEMFTISNKFDKTIEEIFLPENFMLREGEAK